MHPMTHGTVHHPVIVPKYDVVVFPRMLINELRLGHSVDQGLYQCFTRRVIHSYDALNVERADVQYLAARFRMISDNWPSDRQIVEKVGLSVADTDTSWVIETHPTKIGAKVEACQSA
nr:hypothetical protein [Sphingomonas paeninsulae]